MIISASRRTDIPALYGEWFLNRLREGFVYVRNPFNYRQINKIMLNPQVVDCIVFWTKNPSPFFPYLREIEDLGYSFYFQFTLTPYDQRVEKNLPAKDVLIDSFLELGALMGPDRVIWRYDPIFLAEDISLEFHLEHFSNLSRQLRNSTNRCVISFLDLYAKTKRNTEVLRLQTITDKMVQVMAKKLVAVAQDYELEIFSCAETIDLRGCGIKPGKCIDGELIESIIAATLQVRKDKNQRAECGCMESIDLGAYNSCSSHCLYCYANASTKAVITNIGKHHPQSPLLIGLVEDEDKITTREMYSLRDAQTRLF